jgi:hypothetical protein
VDGPPATHRTEAAAAALSAWTAWSLWTLEAGRAESASVWGPVALVYRYAGFWPAVLTLPVFGVLIVGSGWSKVRKLEAEARAAAPPSAPPGSSLR